MTRLNSQFSVEGISLLNSVMHRPAQFGLNSICAIKSKISLEMKFPQLSKPEATAARNQNSFCGEMEKKTLGETRLSWGGGGGGGGSSPMAGIQTHWNTFTRMCFNKIWLCALKKMYWRNFYYVFFYYVYLFDFIQIIKYFFTFMYSDYL